MERCTRVTVFGDDKLFLLFGVVCLYYYYYLHNESLFFGDRKW